MKKFIIVSQSYYSKNKDHGIQTHHFMAIRWEKSGNSDRRYFWGVPKSLHMVTAAVKELDCMLGIRLSFKETVKLFSKVTTPS